jgi:hypothetical protein
MTTPSDRKSAPAYTRESVESYLQAVEAERVRIEQAIGEARSRTQRALRRMHRLDLLERGTVPDGGSGAPGAVEADLMSAIRPLEGPGSTAADSSRLIHSAMVDGESPWLQHDTAATIVHD